MSVFSECTKKTPNCYHYHCIHCIDRPDVTEKEVAEGIKSVERQIEQIKTATKNRMIALKERKEYLKGIQVKIESKQLKEAKQIICNKADTEKACKRYGCQHRLPHTFEPSSCLLECQIAEGIKCIPYIKVK